MFCPERSVECKQTCVGPITLKVEEVRSFEGAGNACIYDVGRTVTSQVCGLDVNEKINTDDWVYDEADVTGLEFANHHKYVVPSRIVTITA